jgi:hypothetical protein
MVQWLPKRLTPKQKRIPQLASKVNLKKKKKTILVVVLKDLFSELNLNSTFGSLCEVRSVDKSRKYRTTTSAFELLLHLSQGQNVIVWYFPER